MQDRSAGKVKAIEMMRYGGRDEVTLSTRRRAIRGIDSMAGKESKRKRTKTIEQAGSSRELEANGEAEPGSGDDHAEVDGQ